MCIRDRPHSVVMWKETDRMDAMAETFYGDSRYWWIICLMNNLVNPFSYNLLMFLLSERNLYVGFF